MSRPLPSGARSTSSQRRADASEPSQQGVAHHCDEGDVDEPAPLSGRLGLHSPRLEWPRARGRRTYRRGDIARQRRSLEGRSAEHPVETGHRPSHAGMRGILEIGVSEGCGVRSCRRERRGAEIGAAGSPELQNGPKRQPNLNCF